MKKLITFSLLIIIVLTIGTIFDYKKRQVNEYKISLIFHFLLDENIKNYQVLVVSDEKDVINAKNNNHHTSFISRFLPVDEYHSSFV